MAECCFRGVDEFAHSERLIFLVDPVFQTETEPHGGHSSRESGTADAVLVYVGSREGWESRKLTLCTRTTSFMYACHRIVLIL